MLLFVGSSLRFQIGYKVLELNMGQKYSKIRFNYELRICLEFFGFLKLLNLKVYVIVKKSNEMIPETKDKEACDLRVLFSLFPQVVQV